MAFERFTKPGRRYVPKASIWKRGQIGFNQGACEKFKISKYQYAILYFDKDTRKIGIEFTNEANSEGAIKIVRSKTAAFLSAKAFMEYYEIPHEQTVQYDIAYDETAKMHVIDLTELEQNV